MKASRFTSPLFAALSALALLGTVAVTGCSTSDMTGPDTAPQAQSVSGSSTTAQDEQEGGGTETGASHNTLPGQD